MRTYLFACVHNAGRSQMAAAFFNQLANTREARAISAGTQPDARVHPVVVAAMREVGIELASSMPQKFTPELARDAEMLITMGCGEACPYVPCLRREDWPLHDPQGLPLDEGRHIRNEIRALVLKLIAAETSAPTE